MNEQTKTNPCQGVTRRPLDEADKRAQERDALWTALRELFAVSVDVIAKDRGDMDPQLLRDLQRAVDRANTVLNATREA